MSLLYEAEIQRVGDAIGLKGKFLVDWGTDSIIEAFTSYELETVRAAEMLSIAADYIEKHCPEEQIFYDGTNCDGYCVAEDCRITAISLAKEAK